MFSLKYCLPFVQKPNSRCSHPALNTQWVIHCKLHSVLAGSLFKSVCFEKVCLITMTAQLKWEGSLPNHPLHSFIPPAVHLEKHLVEQLFLQSFQVLHVTFVPKSPLIDATL